METDTATNARGKVLYVDAGSGMGMDTVTAVSTGDSVVYRCVRRYWKNRELKLYMALVRLHLEYCEQFWAPYLRSEVLALERIQRRFTRMILRKKGSEKDMEGCEFCVEHANMLGHFEIKEEVVLDLLKSIKVDKSLVPRDIYPRLLREAREEIAGVLIKIFVSSLATGDVPECCRVANIVPLFKKGSRDNPGNNRS
eukprot:g46148.t1